MNPCQWWTASPQGEIVFDCNVLSDAVCNNSRRGDWAREVIAWTGREAHEVLVSAMAHGEVLAVLRKLELQQIADSRNRFGGMVEQALGPYMTGRKFKFG